MVWKTKIKRVMKQKVHFARGKTLKGKYTRVARKISYSKFPCGVKKGFYTFEPRKVTCKRCKKVMRAKREK